MARVDNFNRVVGFMEGWRQSQDPDLFYYVEIIRRRKENPSMETGAETIKSFEISDIEDLRKREATIKFLCESTNSRAYIYLNRRSRKRVAKYMLKSLAELIFQSNYSVRSLYAHAVGRSETKGYNAGKSEVDGMVYLIDIDDISSKDYYSKLAAECSTQERFWSAAEFPTVNGVHILGQPFDIKKFMLIALTNQGDNFNFPIPDVHKDNPTLLYYK